ncbi:DUF262 domain-containing protein [Streptomyces sp. SID4915]|uniref:DUF262 domain-containing protein n=1 Tax=Streptomyces albidoflavus TaxID=1886 RepID=A0AB37XHL0_9ACTN|nr:MULTISPECIES: DUF262 domain-containing protein [Streptomyces]MYX84293.1 DUF262 domain-containing protein [Streptomyces sp. SID4915]RZE39915.1 DUF262 domain-containing protein [Streptomyces albidoflavus]SCD55579.1 Protein of unknown function [Streptomyces sp. BvitLS-983]
MPEGTAINDLIPIKSETKTIQDCFRHCLYNVPNFQRPYSWSEEQLADFWNDVILAKGDFFFGSTVTWVSEKRELFNNTYSIIDGQQRLTTSAILLSVVRDAFHKVSASFADPADPDSGAANRQAIKTQEYLIIEDDDGKSYPVLRRSEEIFHEVIQNPNAIPSKVEWNGSARQIGKARSFFEAKVTATIKGLSPDEQVERLKVIRSNALKARVIQVELASEEDGFLVFETLNTRGTDLRLSDLVKNLLIRGGSAEAADRDTISERWGRVVESVQQGHASMDVVDRFIWQSWNSRRAAVKEPELFKALSHLVATDPDAHLDYLHELETDAATYRWLDDEDVQVQKKSTSTRNAFAIPEFVDSVRALAIFNITVANSTIFAVVRKFQETNLIRQSQIVNVLKFVESFHFQYSALTNSTSTGGTRARYNRFAVRLEKAKSASEVAEAIADLKKKLHDSLPDRAKAHLAFRSLFYAPKLNLTRAQTLRSRKIFIAYVLMSFAKLEKLLPAGQNLETWSIEHIKPQSNASLKYDDPVYSIGNLTLLTASLNSAIGNASLSSKIEALRRGSACFDSELESWDASSSTSPSIAQIEKRSHFLADDALDRVWNL